MKGQKAYLSYCRSIGFVDGEGNPLPEFYLLPKKMQLAWAAVEEELSPLQNYPRFHVRTHEGDAIIYMREHDRDVVEGWLEANWGPLIPHNAPKPNGQP